VTVNAYLDEEISWRERLLFWVCILLSCESAFWKKGSLYVSGLLTRPTPKPR
jgi:hypothetical protein